MSKGGNAGTFPAPGMRGASIGAPISGPIPPCMDTIFITGLRVDTLIGAYDWERESRQPLRLDLELTPAPAAALPDGARDAVLDYAKVVAEVRSFVGAREDALLETLGDALCAHLFACFPAASITLRIDKPQAALLLGCEHVGIVIHRQRAA